MRNMFDTRSAVWPCLATAVLLSCGCVTQKAPVNVADDRLGEVPAGARVTVTTTDGRELAIRVTESGPDYIVGIDRHYREYRLQREEIRDIQGRPQNDLIVALAFFAVVFVTGL